MTKIPFDAIKMIEDLTGIPWESDPEVINQIIEKLEEFPGDQKIDVLEWAIEEPPTEEEKEEEITPVHNNDFTDAQVFVDALNKGVREAHKRGEN